MDVCSSKLEFYSRPPRKFWTFLTNFSDVKTSVWALTETLLALKQPWVWSVSDFIFLATAYEGGWPVLFLSVSSSYWQCAISVLIIAELARGRRWNRILNSNFCPGRGLNPEPYDWQSSTLTTRPVLSNLLSTAAHLLGTDHQTAHCIYFLIHT